MKISPVGAKCLSLKIVQSLVMSIISLFCEIDDFFLALMKYQVEYHLPEETEPPEKRGRPRSLHPSEIMTILISFHQSRYRTFKDYYQRHVRTHLRWAFPTLVSYTRFVELQKEVLECLSLYLYTRFGRCDGISFIDSTKLPVCNNRRIPSHRVFATEADRGKTSMGWFYGFKLHLLINSTGDLLGVELTPGNTDDRGPVRELAELLSGKLYGDRGYISSPLREHLAAQGVDLVYRVRKNMDPLPLSETNEVLLKKRTLIESVIKELKSQTQVDHTRHRSVVNFQVNVVSALIAYTYLEKKPSLNEQELQQIKVRQRP